MSIWTCIKDEQSAFDVNMPYTEFHTIVSTTIRVYYILIVFFTLADPGGAPGAPSNGRGPMTKVHAPQPLRSNPGSATFLSLHNKHIHALE